MMTARVFYFDGSDPSIVLWCAPPGWYYQFEPVDPVGPFDSAIDAGKAARAVIVAAAEAEPHDDPSHSCPNCGGRGCSLCEPLDFDEFDEPEPSEFSDFLNQEDERRSDLEQAEVDNWSDGTLRDGMRWFTGGKPWD
jgi:hypothetical protein